MIAKIVKIGNSKGVRIPSGLIKAADLGDTIIMTLERDRIVLSKPKVSVNEEARMSELALREWLLPEEDKAWQHLQ